MKVGKWESEVGKGRVLIVEGAVFNEVEGKVEIKGEDGSGAVVVSWCPTVSQEVEEDEVSMSVIVLGLKIFSKDL
jgi:hypothetical protein